MSTGPIEKKVWGQAGGTTAGFAVAAVVIYLLDQFAFRGENNPVPEQLSIALYTLVPLALGWFAGFKTPHTFRRDSDAVAAERLAEVDDLARRADVEQQLPGQHRRRRPGDE